ncbi:Uncharacterized protein DBV15_01822 [Temnothorax longispinosus]|uniref:Uncharacterized protein n=1 Tax=Temnothorax longispinosus TaxID=300112 RepID=A0A4S2KVA7_9HYME|nr:Uncharacterized protein DBV15_01822 [Temnothorax longispinosus]
MFPDISDFISAKSPPMISAVGCKSLLRLIVDTDEGAETDPSIKSRHRKNKSRQMTMMMTPVKAQDDSAVAPRRAPQGTASMSR